MGLSPEKFGAQYLEVFTQRLKELGHVEGRDFVIDKRFADGSVERLPAIAAELIALRPTVVVAPTSIGAAAFRQATSTVPVVLIAVTDPDKQGFVATLARPGGNKGDPTLERFRPLYRSSFAAVDIEVDFISVGLAENFERVFARIAAGKAKVVCATTYSYFQTHARRIADLALQARLPLFGLRRVFTDAGGLLSYDNDLKEDYRRAAGFVDRILKGAKPADLPVEQPDRFELVINARTAKTLGIKIPQSVLLRATEVIE